MRKGEAFTIVSLRSVIHPLRARTGATLWLNADSIIDGVANPLLAAKIPEYDRLVERQPRFGAIPFNELVNRVPVHPLGIDRSETV
jgi:hypothetical protein